MQTKSQFILDALTTLEWSQTKLALELGLTQPVISRLINGRQDVRKFHIHAINSCLHEQTGEGSKHLTDLL